MPCMNQVLLESFHRLHTPQWRDLCVRKSSFVCIHYQFQLYKYVWLWWRDKWIQSSTWSFDSLVVVHVKLALWNNHISWLLVSHSLIFIICFFILILKTTKWLWWILVYLFLKKHVLMVFNGMIWIRWGYFIYFTIAIFLFYLVLINAQKN